jgi:putative hydrolase of the HAD superfamily
MKGIEAVTFDLWDTLIREEPGGSAKVASLRIGKIADILDSCGRPHGMERLEAAYSATGHHLEEIWSESRDVSVAYQVRFLLRRLDDDLPDSLDDDAIADIVSVYSDSMIQHPPRLLPGAEKALAEVRGSVPGMGLISNTGKTPGRVLRSVMDSLGILRFFDTTTFSDEMLLRKPAPAIFVKTLGDLGVAPRDAVHVGDDLLADIHGAKGVGMRAVHIAGPSNDSDADARAGSLAEVLAALESISGR